MIGRDRGNPQIDLFIAHFKLDPTVLRQSFLRDRHGPAHHFQTRDDRWQQLLRVGIDVDEFAIEPIANPHRSLKRLNVNVRCPQAERLSERLHYQTDDRRVVAARSSFRIAAGHRVTGLRGRGGFVRMIELAQVVLDVLLSDTHEIEFAPDDVR